MTDEGCEQESSTTTREGTSYLRDRLYHTYGSFRRSRSGAQRLETVPQHGASARRLYNQVAPYLATVAEHASILEIGCGEGDFLRELSESGYQYASGIDIAPDMVSAAQQAGLNVRLGDALVELSNMSETFDVVIAIDVVEHLTGDEQLALLERIFERLKENGKLIVKTANGRGLFARQVMYGDFTHEHILTPESLRQVLTTVGFDEIVADEVLPGVGDKLWRLRRYLWSMILLPVRAIRLLETGKRQRIWTENFIAIATKST